MLAKRLLLFAQAKRKKHRKIPAFAPAVIGLYVGRQSATEFSLCTMYSVGYAAASTKLVIQAVTRRGLSREIRGVPWQDGFGLVGLFARDKVYLSASGAAYPVPGGPTLPATIVETPSATELVTLTGSYILSPVRATASWLATPTNGSLWPFVGNGDNLTIGPAYATGQFNLDPLVGPAAYQVAAESSPGVTLYSLDVTRTISAFPGPAGGYQSFGIATYNVAGTDTPAAALNGTNFLHVDSGSGDFAGTTTSGGNSAAWSYSTAFNRAIVWQVSGGSLLAYNYTKPGSVTNNGAYWSWDNAATHGQANYALALPGPPIVRQDDPVAIFQYAVSPGAVAGAASWVLPATAFYGEYRFLFHAFQPFPALAAGAPIPGVPDGSDPAGTMPYWNGGRDFSRPTGTVVTAAFAATPLDFYASATGSATATQWAFAPYHNATGTAQKDVNAYQYGSLYRAGVTDVWGTCLVTASRSSHTSTTGSTTGGFLVEDTATRASYSLSVVWANCWNLGDALVFYPTTPAINAADAARYFVAFNQVGASVLRDALVATGASGSMTYKVDPTLVYTPQNTPFLWRLGPTPKALGITGLAIDGVDPFFEVPYVAGTCLGRRLNFSVLTFLGQRGGRAYWFCSGTSSTATLCPLQTAAPGQAEGTKTFQGMTVKRMGVARVERSFDCIVQVDTTGVSGVDVVASAATIRGSRSYPGSDVGQVLDANGNATGQYVDWATPGGAYARTYFVAGVRANFGSTLTCTATTLVCAASDLKDYAVDAKALNRIDLAALFAHQAQAGCVVACAATPSGYGSSFQAYVLPHAGLLLLLKTPTATTTGFGHVSADAGATWTAISITGDQTIFRTGNGGYNGNGGQPGAPGAALFAY